MDPLTSLTVATVLFVGTHLLMSHPLRAGLVARLGERGFAGVYSLVAAALLVWMILAYRSDETRVVLWQAPPEAGWAVSLVTLIASTLLVGSLVRNPAFPHPGAQPREIPAPRGVFAITRHPMNWSFMLWALSHIAWIGTPRNLVVAVGILALALLGSLGQDKKKQRLMGEVWRDWQARTSFVPFAALVAGRARWSQAVPSAIAVIGGFALWGLVTSRHAPQWSPAALLG